MLIQYLHKTDFITSMHTFLCIYFCSWCWTSWFVLLLDWKQYATHSIADALCFLWQRWLPCAPYGWVLLFQFGITSEAYQFGRFYWVYGQGSKVWFKWVLFLIEFYVLTRHSVLCTYMYTASDNFFLFSWIGLCYYWVYVIMVLRNIFKGLICNCLVRCLGICHYLGEKRLKWVAHV